MVRGWKIRAREASWRCWAMESAISFRAAILLGDWVRGCVLRSGRSGSGSGLEVRGASSEMDVMVARVVGWSGGSVPDEEGSRKGVDVFEFSVEGGRTRFARRKKKKAGGWLAWSLSFERKGYTQSCILRPT